MNFACNSNEITITADPVTEPSHEIEKTYLGQFKKAVIEMVEDPRDSRTWQIKIKLESK